MLIFGCGGGEDVIVVIVIVFFGVAIVNVFYLFLEFFVFLDQVFYVFGDFFVLVEVFIGYQVYQLFIVVMFGVFEGEVVLLEVDVVLDGVGVYFYGVNYYFLLVVICEGMDLQYFCCFDGFLVGSDCC